MQISPAAVADVLRSRAAPMPASELAARFAPADDRDRQRLVQALSAVADVIPPARDGEEATVRLKGMAPAKPAGGGYYTPRGGPLPIEPIAVRALLLAQPRQEMPAAELRERFGPAASEAERLALVAAISAVAEVLPTPDGPLVRLLPTEQRPALPSSSSGGGGKSAFATGSQQHQPITPVERDLVRKVLSAAPAGSMRPADLVHMLAPTDPAAKRRLARVLSEVATVASQPDGTPCLVLRDATNGGTASSACFAGPGGFDDDPSDGGSVASGSRGMHHAGRGGAAAHAGARRPRHGVGSSAVGSLSGSALSEASTRSVGLPSGMSWAASGQQQPPPPPVPEDVEPTPSPTVVTEDLVVALLRKKGGRMASHVLISRLQPLDRQGQRALASVVQRVCTTVLDDGPAGTGATIVLRETLLRERVETRCATTIQRARRTQHAQLLLAVRAAMTLQAGARRRIAVLALHVRRGEDAAARIVQEAARRRAYVHALATARLELRAALTLQMAARRWALAARVVARGEAREHAATALQSGRRAQLAKRTVAALAREALIARETPEERAVREERERTALLREKLRRRKRHAAAGPAGGAPAAAPAAALAAAPAAPATLEEHAVGTEAGAAAGEAAAARRGRWAAPAVEAAADEAPETGVGARPLSPGELLPAGGDARDDVAAAAVDEPSTDGGGGELGGELGLAEGEDFLAAMRAMMAQHGGDDDDDDDDDA